MIKYSLVCKAAHEFESWFRSGDDFERQIGSALIECPTCGSQEIEKAVMAPHVARRDRARAAAPPGEAPAASNETHAAVQPVALLGEDDRAMRQAFRELRARIIAHSVDVGDRFAEEARRMHEGASPARSIRGETTAQEAEALWEEGIPVLPLPAIPDERN